MTENNENATFIFNSKLALPNKLLQDDGTITDITGKQVINAIESYNAKPALPNKFLNPDGTYSTLNEIIASMVDTSIFVIVNELPAEGDPQKIYLVPDDKGGFVEYHWTGTSWDAIGTVDIDLSDYSTTQEMMNAIEASALLTLNSAKAYTDDKIDDIEITPQVFYWNGNTQQDGLSFWNNIYQIQKTTPCVVFYTVQIPNASMEYKTFMWKYNNDLPISSSSTSSGNKYSFDFSAYSRGSGFHKLRVIMASLYFTVTNDVISKISFSTSVNQIQYLDTQYDYNPTYTPLYDGSPATKKYVDDSVATNITNVLGGSY